MNTERLGGFGCVRAGFFLAVMVALGCWLGTGTARAQTWNGASDPTTVDWSEGGNWVGGVAPLSSTDTVLVFDGTTNQGSDVTPLNQDIATPMDVDSLQFLSSGFYLGGGALRITPTDSANGIYAGAATTVNIANSLTLGANARFSHAQSGASAINVNGGLDLGSSTLSLVESWASGASLKIDFNSLVSGTGGIHLVGTAGTSIYFRESNTFSGGITAEVTADKNLYVMTDQALGTGPVTIITRVFARFRAAAGPVSLPNNFTFGSDNAAGREGRTIFFEGDITLTGDTFTLDGTNTTVPDQRYTLEGANTLLTINNVIQDANPANPREFPVAYGAGTMIIANAANTYLGPTTVGLATGGHTLTVAVNGSIASSSGVAVNPDATLAGAGTVSDVTVGAAGKLRPGYNPADTGTLGTLAATGDVALQDESLFLIRVGAGGAADRLAATGSLTLGTDVVLQLTGALDGSSSYTVATFASQSGAFGSVLLNGSEAEFTSSGYSLAYEDDAIMLVIPEPGTLALLFGSGMMVWALRRRRVGA